MERCRLRSSRNILSRIICSWFVDFAPFSSKYNTINDKLTCSTERCNLQEPKPSVLIKRTRWKKLLRYETPLSSATISCFDFADHIFDVNQGAEEILHIKREMSLHLDYCAEFGLSKKDVEEQEEHQGNHSSQEVSNAQDLCRANHP